MSFIATCFGGPLLRRFVAEWWAGYKARHTGDVVHMKLRAGRWHAAGFIRSVDMGVDWFTYVGMACIVLGIIGAVFGALH